MILKISGVPKVTLLKQKLHLLPCISLRTGQELHASPHIEHTPHIVLSIIHIRNVLSIYEYVGYHEVLTVVSDTLLFWYSWLKSTDSYSLVTGGTFCFHFCRVLGSLFDCGNVNLSERLALKTLRGAQSVCAP